MSHHCFYERRKSRFGTILVSATITALLCAIAMILILWAGWYGLSKDLCARHLPATEYQAMKLDCKDYGYDKQ